jgi:alkylated DNA repair dioxygenase AlkB
MTSTTHGPELDGVQLDLFDGDEIVADEMFGTAQRVWLDETSWVEHVPGWLSGSHQLLARLRDSAGWEQRQRWMYTQLVTEPRLTAEYPVLADAPQPELRDIAVVLSAHYGVDYDRAWMNLYRDHQDGTGWHADRPANRPETAIVPVLSLGATRRFLIRPEAGGASTVFSPASGDLIVMGGRCQRDWRHSVPKQKTPAGPRSSINFSSRQQS